MNRSTGLLVIGFALVLYGVYAASFVPGLLVGGVPALLIGFILQAACAIAAAIGVWRGASWAPAALVLLGAAVAGTWLFEGFILGLVVYLHALAMAIVAVVLTLISAAYVRHPRAL